MSEDTYNRRKRILITREVLTPILRGDVGVVAGLPDDVKCVQIYRDPERDVLVAVVQSDEFEPVAEGEVIPPHEAITVALDYDDPRRS